MSSVLLALVLSQPIATLTGSPTRQSNQPGGGLPAIQASPPSQAPFNYVVIITMNNASADSIYGNPDAPYLNSLASTYGYATSYTAVAQYSVPNYLAMIAGDTFVSQECDPTTCPVNAVNIVDQIEAAGLTWKAWAEDYPLSQGCSLTLTNAGYVARHFPFVYFQDITGNQARCNNLLLANSAASSSIETDDLFLRALGSTSTAANYMWLTPNKCDDLHDCPVSTGDSYLSQLVPSILNSYIFKTQKAALFIVTAEGMAKVCPCPTDYMPAIWAGPAAKTNFQSSSQYDHYSLLKTVETAWSLASVTSNDDSASPMTEFLQPAGPQLGLSYTPTSPVTGQSVGFTATATGGTPPYTFSWNFGDGTSNTGGGTGNPNLISHSYAGTGTYAVTVTATDSASKLGSTTASVTVAAPLIVSVSGPSTGTVGTSVSFTSKASGGTTPYSFNWNFGDGTANVATGTTSSASHTYSSAGTFTVSVDVTDSKGRLATASTSIAVSAPTLIVVATGPSSGEQGLAADFSATASGGTLPYSSFKWIFGDGSTGTGSSTIHMYSSPGTFSVTVTVTDSTGATSTSTALSIVIAPPLQVSSTNISPNPTDAGTAISFTASISGGVTPVSCQWVFGDGSMASTCSATHTYSAGGTFAATLTATDSIGVSVTTSISVAVNPGLSVRASAGPNPQPTVGGTVAFNATVSGGASPVSCNWDFGDGSTTTGCTATHAYSTQGTFSAAVTATDSLGVTATSSVTVTIGTPLAVILGISPDPAELTIPSAFTATASGGTSPYISYSWNFGDGSSTTTTTANVTHTYASKGTFTATVIVTDSNSQTASASVSVTINAQLTLIANAISAPTEVSIAVNFTSTISGGVTPFTCSWSFGDGGIAHTCSATHTYSSTGTFPTNLTVTDSLGITATSSVSVTVNTRLTVNAVASPNPVELSKTVGFNATLSGGVGSAICSWNFGDGTTGTGCSTTHTYTSVGTFTATVAATDGLAVTATCNLSATVNAKLAVTANANPNPTEAGTAVGFTAPTTGGVGTATCLWSFGDGGMASTCSSSHTYATGGAFNVTIIATDGLGVTATTSVAAKVNAKLSVTSVSVSPNPTQVNKSTGLTATVTGGVGVATCSWNFADGATGSGCSTIHIYTTSGTYTVTVTATDSLGISKTSSATLTVIGPFAVDFTFIPTTPTNGQQVNFTAASNGGTSPYSFSWSFGDGSTGLGVSVSHTYTIAGAFIVTLSVVDAVGQAEIVTHSIGILADIPPIFTYAPPSETVTVGESLNFTISAYDPNGAPVSITAETLPQGASFNPQTGEFSWIPAADQPGNYTITFKATTNNTPPTGSSETIAILVKPVLNQNCRNCLALGIPLNIEVVMGITIFGVISTLAVSIFIGTRDRDESRFSGTRGDALTETGTDRNAYTHHRFPGPTWPGTTFEQEGADY